MLYIVATPIGNLEDITLRALRILQEADLIVAEDTRRVAKLLQRHAIATPTQSYHQHSGPVKLDFILNQLKQGRVIALVSDAGTPAISDPGGQLVELASQAGVEVSPIPGPSAVTAALSVSGFPAQQFLFLGYLPKKKGRATILASLKDYLAGIKTVVLYESPQRLGRTLSDLKQGLGENQVCIGREMTKLYEQIFRGTLTQAIEHFSGVVKGELTIVLHTNSKVQSSNTGSSSRLKPYNS